MSDAFSRKQFLALGVSAWFATRPAAPQTGNRITARDVIARIQQNVGVPWKDPTVDTFKAGNPDGPLKGVATTMMATFDVLQRAARSGRNLVITHEPTFYNHDDNTQAFASDRVLAEKMKFIAEHDLVIWRFHDHWHARRPDGITAGMSKALAWEKYRSAEGAGLFDFPRPR